MWLCHDWLLADFQEITIDITEYRGNRELLSLVSCRIICSTPSTLHSLLSNLSDLGVASHPVPLYDLDMPWRIFLATYIHSLVLSFLSGHYNWAKLCFSVDISGTYQLQTYEQTACNIVDIVQHRKHNISIDVDIRIWVENEIQLVFQKM